MDILDIIVLLVLAIFGLTGFKNGLAKEVLGMFGIVIAIFLSIHYSDSLTTLIHGLTKEQSSTLPWISFIILLISTLVAFQVLIYLITGLLNAMSLGIPNRLFGMLFGMLKSGLIISIVLLVLAGFNLPSQKTRSESFTYSYMILIAPTAYNLIAFIYPGAKSYTQTVKKTINTYNPLNHIPTLDNH